MKFYIFTTALTLTASLLLFSCKKDSATTTNPTKTELITRAAWKYDDAGADADKNGTIDISLTSQIPSCSTDNFLTLSANGTGTVDEGPTKCDPSAPQTTPLTWSFASNEGFLNLGGSGIIGIGGQFKIITLDQTTLTLSKDTTYQGVPMAMVVKLKH